MTIKPLFGKKFLLVAATSVLGFGVIASFIVPSANASSGALTSVTNVSPAAPETPSVEASSSEPSNTGVETSGIDCNNGLDATGAQCDGGPAANPNDGGVDSQSATDGQSEVASSIDGDNVQN